MLVGSAREGSVIEGSDGTIGTVSDFLFDDSTWKIRWMVAATGTWLTGRKLLIHPSAIAQPNDRREELAVRLSSQQVEDSPESLIDAPVPRQMAKGLSGHYGRDPLWGGGNYLGSYSYGMGAAFEGSPSRGGADLIEAERSGSLDHEGDSHLRSLTAVVGYHIQAKNGPIGHVENFLVDDVTWGIRYLIIDTKSWWPGQHVLMSPSAVREISWSERGVTLEVTSDQIRSSSTWDPAEVIEEKYKEILHGPLWFVKV